MSGEFKFAIKPFRPIEKVTDDGSIDSIITRIDGKFILITRVPENKSEHREDAFYEHSQQSTDKRGS
jgi:hypothetical protein